MVQFRWVENLKSLTRFQVVQNPPPVAQNRSEKDQSPGFGLEAGVPGPEIIVSGTEGLYGGAGHCPISV